ncbi:FG-GAP-like repeat-containing protein [Phyllobacterium leguminum]|uniref:VCBS repeat protein n=1 Tax=Phyllobacterium leguminum TaxID=314237 RepID=A0A318T0X7_9HYPH|nr:FG-GAP-like repeat-containing protein [Phyllobacterium leguminum]PYE86406.1 VCBS repeat protein [Phyllobacterium leguminum]
MHIAQEVADLFRRIRALLSCATCFCLLFMAQAVSVQAAAAPTTTVLTASPASPVKLGTVVALTATVTATPKVTKGTVLFCNGTVTAVTQCIGTKLIGRVQVDGTVTPATATLKLAPPMLATDNTYKAFYVGNTAFAASGSTAVAVTVKPGEVTVNLDPPAAVPAKPGFYNFAATVSAVGSPVGPTGGVNFLDIQSGLNLGNGLAALSAPTKPALTLPPVQSYPTAMSQPIDQAVADFDEDGNLDLAVLSVGGNGSQFVVYFNDKAGQPMKQPGTPYQTSKTTYDSAGMVAGDVDNNGTVDLVVSNSGAGGQPGFVVFKNTGAGGNFQAQALIPVPPADPAPGVLALADFNNDGDLDLASMNPSGATMTVTFYQGDGSLKFTKVTPTPIAVGPGGNSLLAADFNADGLPDLAVVANPMPPALPIVQVWENKSAWAFPAFPSSPYTLSVLPPKTVAFVMDVGDLNDDGYLDLLVGNSATNVLPLLLGKGAGVFDTPKAITVTGVALMPAIADYNADGKPDFAYTADKTGEVFIMESTDPTTTTYTAGPSVYVGNSVFQVDPGDFNNDGVPDLVVTAGGDATVNVASVILETSATATIPSKQVVGTANEQHAISASYEGDNHYPKTLSNLELAAAQPITTTLVLTPPTFPQQGQPMEFKATLTPYKYQTLLTEGEAVNFYVDSDPTPFLTAYLKDGVAQASTTSDKLTKGQHKITATYVGDDYFTTSTDATTGNNPLNVGPPVSGTTVSLKIDPVAQTLVKFTATVTANPAGTAVSPGVVNFCRASGPCTGLNFIGTAQLTPAGTAELTASIVGTPGTNYNAVFMGTPQYNGGVSPPVVGLDTAPKAKTETALGLGAPANNKVDLTATVTSYGALHPEQKQAHVEFLTLDAPNGNVVGSVGKAQPLTEVTGAAKLTMTGVETKLGGETQAGIVLADFDQNNSLDLAICNPAQGTVHLLESTNTGTFQNYTAQGTNPATLTAAGAAAIVTADFNNDGFLDLVVAGTGKLFPFKGAQGGKFTAAPTEPSTLHQASDIAAADFNRDGILDIVITSGTGNDNYVGVFLGDGSLGFKPTSALPVSLAGIKPTAIVAADFDGDTWTDVAVNDATVGSNQLVLLRGLGDGTFDNTTPYKPKLSGVAEWLAVGDFDNNGDLDIATANSNGSVSVLVGQGKWIFTEEFTTVSASTGGNGIAIGDFNGDGWQDVAASDKTKFLNVFLGTGNGTFSGFPPSIHLTPTDVPGAVAVGDLNFDGLPDAVTTEAVATTGGVYAGVGVLTDQAIAKFTGAQGTVGADYVQAHYIVNDLFADSYSPLPAQKLPVAPPTPPIATTLKGQSYVTGRNNRPATIDFEVKAAPPGPDPTVGTVTVFDVDTGDKLGEGPPNTPFPLDPLPGNTYNYRASYIDLSGKYGTSTCPANNGPGNCGVIQISQQDPTPARALPRRPENVDTKPAPGRAPQQPSRGPVRDPSAGR